MLDRIYVEILRKNSKNVKNRTNKRKFDVKLKFFPGNN